MSKMQFSDDKHWFGISLGLTTLLIAIIISSNDNSINSDTLVGSVLVDSSVHMNCGTFDPCYQECTCSPQSYDIPGMPGEDMEMMNCVLSGLDNPYTEDDCAAGQDACSGFMLQGISGLTDSTNPDYQRAICECAEMKCADTGPNYECISSTEKSPKPKSDGSSSCTELYGCPELGVVCDMDPASRTYHQCVIPFDHNICVDDMWCCAGDVLGSAPSGDDRCVNLQKQYTYPVFGDGVKLGDRTEYGYQICGQGSLYISKEKCEDAECGCKGSLWYDLVPCCEDSCPECLEKGQDGRLTQAALDAIADYTEVGVGGKCGVFKCIMCTQGCGGMYSTSCANCDDPNLNNDDEDDDPNWQPDAGCSGCDIDKEGCEYIDPSNPNKGTVYTRKLYCDYGFGDPADIDDTGTCTPGGGGTFGGAGGAGGGPGPIGGGDGGTISGDGGGTIGDTGGPGPGPGTGGSSAASTTSNPSSTTSNPSSTTSNPSSTTSNPSSTTSNPSSTSSNPSSSSSSSSSASSASSNPSSTSSNPSSFGSNPSSSSSSASSTTSNPSSTSSNPSSSSSSASSASSNPSSTSSNPSSDASSDPSSSGSNPSSNTSSATSNPSSTNSDPSSSESSAINSSTISIAVSSSFSSNGSTQSTTTSAFNISSITSEGSSSSQIIIVLNLSSSAGSSQSDKGTATDNNDETTVITPADDDSFENIINVVKDSLVAAASVCGNGTLETGEECDDTNRRDNDGCSSSCLLEIGICGDGIIQSLLGEQCEISTHASGLPYSCQNCRFVSLFCGDGKLDSGEECDQGPLNSTSADADCRPDCSLSRCGDAVLDTAEICDDGNRRNNDGCDRYCRVEESDTTGVTVIAADQNLIDFNNTAPIFTQYQGNVQFPQYPNFQQLPYQLPLAQLQPLIQTQGPVGDTGPAAVAVVASGMAAGLGFMRRRRK